MVYNLRLFSYLKILRKLEVERKENLEKTIRRKKKNSLAFFEIMISTIVKGDRRFPFVVEADRLIDVT